MIYRAIRRNYILGRLWEEGETVDVETCPSHHFELAPGQEATIKLAQSGIDPMKPFVSGIDSGTPTTLSQAGKKPSSKGGFAGTFKDSKPLSPKDMKKEK